jgi:hypothetical protein
MRLTHGTSQSGGYHYFLLVSARQLQRFVRRPARSIRSQREPDEPRENQRCEQGAPLDHPASLGPAPHGRASEEEEGAHDGRRNTECEWKEDGIRVDCLPGGAEDELEAGDAEAKNAYREAHAANNGVNAGPTVLGRA